MIEDNVFSDNYDKTNMFIRSSNKSYQTHTPLVEQRPLSSFHLTSETSSSSIPFAKSPSGFLGTRTMSEYTSYFGYTCPSFSNPNSRYFEQIMSRRKDKQKHFSLSSYQTENIINTNSDISLAHSSQVKNNFNDQPSSPLLLPSLCTSASIFPSRPFNQPTKQEIVKTDDKMRPQSPLDPLLTDNFLSWQPVHSAHLQQCPDTEIEMYGKKFSVIYDYYKLHMQMKWRKNDELRNQSSLCPSAFAKIQESDAKNEKSTLTENCFDKDEEGKEGDENNIITDKRDDEDIYLNEEETEEKKRRLRMIRQEIKEAKEFRKVFGEWVRKDWISDKDEIAMWDAAEQKIKEKEEKQMPCMENTENKGNQTILNVNGKLNESTLEELQILLKEELERGTLESDLKELMESISSKASKEEKRQRMREMSELERYFAEIDEKRGKIQKKRKEEEALKCEGIQKTEGEEQIENNKEMDNKETTSENAYLGDDKEGETGIHISSNLDERNEHLSKAIQQKGISLHSLTKSSVFFFSTKTDSSERESDLDKKEDDFPLMSQKVDLDGNNCQEIQTEGHFSDISKELSENLKNLSEHSKAQLSNNLPLILRMQPFSSSRVSPSLSTSPTFYEPFICSPNSTRTSPQISPETKKMLRNIKSSNDLCFISSKYNSSPSELLSSSPFDSKESDVPVYTMDIADSSFSTQSQHILSVQTFLNYSHASDEVYFIVPLLFLPFSKTAFNSPFDAHSFQKTANEVLLTKRKNFHEVTLSVLNQRFFLKTPPQRKFLWCFDKVEENEKKRQKVLYYKKLHSLNNGTLKDYLISRDGELEPQNPVVQTEYFPPNVYFSIV